MAGAGYKNWTAGDVPTAAQFDTFLQEQTIMVFTNAADRDTQLSTVKAEGMYAFLKDTNVLTVYTGSLWSTLGTEFGALPNWTPVVTQSVGVAVTSNYATYIRQARRVECRFTVTVTGAGTGANPIIVSGFPFTGQHSFGAIGSGYVFDSSASATYTAVVALAGVNQISLLSTNSLASDLRLGTNNFTAALAANDVISGTFVYEAAAD